MAKAPTMPLTGILKAADQSIADADRERAENMIGAMDGPLNPAEPLLPDESSLDFEGDPSPTAPLKAGDYVTATFNHAGTVVSVEKTDPPVMDPVGYLGVEFGPTNEFTERRISTLKQDLAGLIDAVHNIDAQLAHLNARRTDAMLACSGITADLDRLGAKD